MIMIIIFQLVYLYRIAYGEYVSWVLVWGTCVTQVYELKKYILELVRAQVIMYRDD